MSVLAMVFGLVFLHAAYKQIVTGKFDMPLVYNILVGIVCLGGSRMYRSIYLSDVGIVREMHTWNRVTRQITPWEDVQHVTLAFRRGKLTAFFEIDTTGKKVLFSRDQEQLIRDILDEYIPDVEVLELPDYGRN